MRSTPYAAVLLFALILLQPFAKAQAPPAAAPENENPSQLGKAAAPQGAKPPAAGAPPALTEARKIPLFELRLEIAGVEKQMAAMEAQFLQHQREAERLQRQYAQQKLEAEALQKTFHGKLVQEQGGSPGHTVTDKLDWMPCRPVPPNGQPLPGCPEFEKLQPNAAESVQETGQDEQPPAAEGEAAP